MTDAEIKAELEAQLALVNAKIRSTLTIAAKYTVDTGSSKRSFEDDLKVLYDTRDRIRAELALYEDTNYATVFAPSW